MPRAYALAAVLVVCGAPAWAWDSPSPPKYTVLRAASIASESRKPLWPAIQDCKVQAALQGKALDSPCIAGNASGPVLVKGAIYFGPAASILVRQAPPRPLDCNAAMLGLSADAPCKQAQEHIEGSDAWEQSGKSPNVGDSQLPRDFSESYARSVAAKPTSAPAIDGKAIAEFWERSEKREPGTALHELGTFTLTRPPSLLKQIFGDPAGLFRTDKTIYSGQQTVQPGTGTRGVSTAPIGPAVAQRVVLFEEDPSNPEGDRYVGSALWRTETVSTSPGQAHELAIRVDVAIHGRPLAMTMSIRRNTDAALPASHIVEIAFNLPADFNFGGVASVPGLLAKEAEQMRGAPLSGLAVKVTGNFFLIGLSAVEADLQRNLTLLKERSWFDIPIVYNNGRRGIIAVEKGTSGQRSFEEALAQWNPPQAPSEVVPAQAPAQTDLVAPPPPQATHSAYVNPPLVIERVVPANESRTIYFVSQIFPDCSSRGPVVARITEPPKSGGVSFEAGESFSTFTQAPYMSCSDKKVEGLSVKYEPYPRYEGPDAFAGVFILPDGRARKFEFRITVQ